MKRVLLVTPEFRYVCGRSKNVSFLARFLLRNGYDVYIMTDTDESMDYIKSAGAKAVICRYPFSKRDPLSFLKHLFFILRTVRKFNIDIIHTHHRYPEVLSYLVRPLPGMGHLKLVTTVHSSLVPAGLIKFPSDRIIAVSDYVKDELLRIHKTDPAKITRIYNYTDLPSEIPLTENKVPVILSAGRFSREKGFDTVIEALKLLNENSAEFVLLGEGEEDENFRKEFVNLKINAVIEKAVEDAGSYLDKCDLCIVPSRTEGLSYVIIEAGSRKKAVIAAATGGIKELIIDGQTGLLFEPGNFTELGSKIKILLSNPVLRETLGNKLNQRIKENFTSFSSEKQLLELYGNL